MKSNERGTHLWMIAFLVLATVIGSGRLHWAWQSGAIRPVASRQEMPALTLPQLGGGEWSLADHRGQVVLINYWATWCEPCREELPGLMRLARDTSPKDLAVVGVSLDSGPDTQAMVRSFATQFRMPYPVLFPVTQADRDMGEAGIPTTVLLDKHGRIAKTYFGPAEREDFARDVASLLAES